MTRTLIILRHAKSDWQTASANDHERPLNARGQRAAAVIGVYLKQQGLAPDLVLTSTAIRARETCAHVLYHGAFDLEPAAEQALYLASPERIMQAVRGQPADARCILVIGHNPGMQALAASIAASSDRPQAEVIRADFPTAALAICRSDRPWSEADPQSMTLDHLVTPKALI